MIVTHADGFVIFKKKADTMPVTCVIFGVREKVMAVCSHWKKIYIRATVNRAPLFVAVFLITFNNLDISHR